MAALGEMIGNISHQWRQPLSIISSAATGMEMQKKMGTFNDENLIKFCTTINDQAQYLSKTIDTFRNFVKQDKTPVIHPIEEEIASAINILKASLDSKDIQLIDQIDYNGKNNVNCVRNELSEVIINVINNAKDIITEREIANGWIKIELNKAHNKIILTIEDNGKGIEDAVLPRIFEPYYTTRHKSKGTGLGLHMSYKIVVESCEGQIYAINSEYGAKFFIELPLSI